MLVNQCAAKHGKCPAEFRAQPVDDQAQMIAGMLFQATCDAYRHYKQQQRLKGRGRDGSKYSKETNPYWQLLRSMGG